MRTQVPNVDRGDGDAQAGSSLFEPTVQDHVARMPGAHELPWRVTSQGYVAFFGGPLAIAIVAVMNAPKLGLPRSDQVKIAVACTVAFAAAVALAVTVVGTGTDAWRAVFPVFGLAAYAVAAWIQRRADRRWRFRHGDERYESLLPVGIGAVLAARFAEGAVLIPLIAA